MLSGAATLINTLPDLLPEVELLSITQVCMSSVTRAVRIGAHLGGSHCISYYCITSLFQTL